MKWNGIKINDNVLLVFSKWFLVYLGKICWVGGFYVGQYSTVTVSCKEFYSIAGCREIHGIVN